jgi:hypothetical protein
MILLLPLVTHSAKVLVVVAVVDWRFIALRLELCWQVKPLAKER